MSENVNTEKENIEQEEPENQNLGSTAERSKERSSAEQATNERKTEENIKPTPSQLPQTSESTPGPQTEQSRKPSQNEKNPADVLNTEFIYYGAILRTYAPSLTREFDKGTTFMWLRKLFGPEYHSTILKPKRNRYLSYLTITLYNDEAYGIFRQEPPAGVLPDIKDIKFDTNIPPAAWELEKQWQDTFDDLPEDLKMSQCYLHSNQNDCIRPENNMAQVLDAQFQFFLWLSRPYVALLSDPVEKTQAACWIQLLCGIAARDEDCVAMKELRNDYMQALLGYIHDLRVEGPFKIMPPVGPIAPLATLFEDCNESDDFRDPVGEDAEEFLASQPLPDCGAFAYINVTGELFKT